MNNQEIKKYQYKNSKYPIDKKLYPNFNQNIQNPNPIPPKYANKSIYSGTSKNNDGNDFSNMSSYEQKLREKNLIIQKLQNTISNFNNNEKVKLNYQNKLITSYKEKIIELNQEIATKDEIISEQNNEMISKNNKLEQELLQYKNKNNILNKNIIQLKKVIKVKDEEIYAFKEKVKVLISQINEKNKNISKLKEDNNILISKMQDLENKYINLSNKQNLKSKPQTKIETNNNNNSDNSSDEDGLKKIADIIVNEAKLIKEENLWDTMSHNNLTIRSKNYNLKQKNIIENNNENEILKLNSIINKKNEQIKLLTEEKQKIINNLNAKNSQNAILNKLLTQKNSEIIRYQKENFEKQININKLASLLSEYQNLVTTSSPLTSSKSLTKVITNQNQKYDENLKNVGVDDYNNDSPRYDYERGYSKDVTDNSNNGENNVYFNICLNSNEKKKNNNNEVKNLKIQLLEKTKKIGELSKINELLNIKIRQNINENNNINNLIDDDISGNIKNDFNNNQQNVKLSQMNKKLSEQQNIISNLMTELNTLRTDCDNLKLLKEEAEKSKNDFEKNLSNKTIENLELQKKIESIEKSLNESISIIKQKDITIREGEGTIQDYEKIISTLDKSLKFAENYNKDYEKSLIEKNDIIKEKTNNITLLENNKEILLEEINKLKTEIKKITNDLNSQKEQSEKNNKEKNISNSELLKQKQFLNEEKNKYEKENKILKLDNEKLNNEIQKNLNFYNLEKQNYEKKIIEYNNQLDLVKNQEKQNKNLKNMQLIQIENLKKTITNLKNELANSEENIKKLKNEIEFKENLNQSELNKTDLESNQNKDIELLKIKDYVNILKNELETNNKELYSTKLSLRIMTEAKENKDRQIDELNEDIEGYLEKIEKLENEKKSNEINTQKIINEKNNINNELIDIKLLYDKEKIFSADKDKKSEILSTNLKNKISELTNEKNKLESENNVLKKEIQKLNEDLDLDKKNYMEREKENNQLRTSKNEMILKLSTLNDEKFQLKKSLNIFETKDDETQKEIKKLQNDLANKENKISNQNKEINLLTNEKEKLSKEISKLIDEKKQNDINITKNNDLIKELQDENNEKTTQIESLIKNITDYEIQIKGLKDEKQELYISNKKNINELKEVNKKYTVTKKNFEDLKKKCAELEENSKKNNQNNSNNMIVEINDSMLEKEEEINKLKQKLDDFQNILKQKGIEVEKYRNANLELKKNIEKLKNDFQQKLDHLTILEKTGEKIMNEKETEMSSVVEEHKETIKENISLKNKIMQLNENINELNEQLEKNNILISEKEKELNNLKEISKAVIDKQKNIIENSEKIDPNNWTIISSKIHKKLTWYLLLKKITDIKKPIDENNYNNYQWVNANIIRREDLKKFNNFEDDEKKIKDLHEYIFDLQKKLERKEELLSHLDYKNKKLTEQVHNKTTSVKGAMGFSRVSENDKNLKFKNNFANSMSSNEGMGEINIEKYKDILDQLNDSNRRETNLHNQIIELKTQLKKKEEFESGMPNDMIDIDKHSIGSDFLDDDLKNNFISKENNKSEVKSSKVFTDTFNYKEAEKKADDFLKNGVEESDMDEMKLMQKQMGIIKGQLKDSETNFNQLSEQVKELLKHIKCDTKIKPQIVQICQIFGYSPQTTKRIVNNKKGGILSGILK